MTSKIREEVHAHLVGLFVEAKKLGLNDFQARRWVEAQCPGVPDMVLILAEVDAEALEVESWWQAVERTIDGEIIQRALSAPAGGSPPPKDER